MLIKHLLMAIQRRQAQRPSRLHPLWLTSLRYALISTICAPSRLLHDVDVHCSEEVLQGVYDRRQPVVLRGEILLQHTFCDLRPSSPSLQPGNQKLADKLSHTVHQDVNGGWMTLSDTVHCQGSGYCIHGHHLPPCDTCWEDLCCHADEGIRNHVLHGNRDVELTCHVPVQTGPYAL